MKLRFKLGVFAALLACGACDSSSPNSGRITVFAAASLEPVAQALSGGQASGEVVLNCAASSTLARQIEAGAEADVFLSAHPEWIEWLRERDLIEPGSVRDVASGELVWIVPRAAKRAEPFNLSAEIDLAERFNGRVAIGDPTFVPLGRYTQAALENLKLWSGLRDRLAPALDARATLRLVELGEVDAGIVYASDAALSTRVLVLARFPNEAHPPIRYQAVLLRGASESAALYLDELSSMPSAKTFEAFGFLPPTP